MDWVRLLVLLWAFGALAHGCFSSHGLREIARAVNAKNAAVDRLSKLDSAAAVKTKDEESALKELKQRAREEAARDVRQYVRKNRRNDRFRTMRSFL